MNFIIFEGFEVTKTFFWQGAWLFIGVTIAFSVCSAKPRITTIQEVSESADAPYDNILVIALFEKYDTRRRLEKDIVRNLSEQGVNSVASTSMMTTKTPMTRQTYLAMVDKLDSDSALVTQLVDIESKVSLEDSASPEATWNVRPTYYFNVWNVELTEYMEPKSLEIKGTLMLATQLYSAHNGESVWAIESKIKVKEQSGARQNYMISVDEAKAIVKRLSKEKLIAR